MVRYSLLCLLVASMVVMGMARLPATSISLPKAAVIASPNKSPDNNLHMQHHGMSLTTLIINIVADLSPHGMLPLAYGIAQGGPSGIVPAIMLTVFFGSMSASTM
jgi:hypothetical protein